MERILNKLKTTNKLHKTEIEHKLTRYESIEEAEQKHFFSDIK